MRKITKILLSLFLASSILIFPRGNQAATTRAGLENKKPDSLILRHHKDLKKADMIAWSWESDRDSGRNHWSHSSHSSHYSHYSHYSSRY